MSSRRRKPTLGNPRMATQSRRGLCARALVWIRRALERREVVRRQPQFLLIRRQGVRAVALSGQRNRPHGEDANIVRRTLEHHPREFHGLLVFDVGFVLGQQGDLAGGLDHLNRAIQLDPKFAQAHYTGGGSLNCWTKSAGAVQTLSVIKRKLAHSKPPRVTRCLISL